MNRTRIWRTVQNSTWLLGGVAMLAIAFSLWIGMQIHQRITVEKDLKAKDVPVEPEKVQFSPTLGMMTDMVPELDINQNISTSERTAEFRGASFIKAQSGNWTVHVMSVSQEDIIKGYLEKRTDREKFFYLRSRKPDQGERYILVYGSFPSVGKALQASKTINFDLPSSVKAYPVRFSEFKSSVSDDVGSEDSITNLSKAAQVYQVRLRSVPVPLEAPAAPATPSSPIDSRASTQRPAAEGSASSSNNVATTPGTTQTSNATASSNPDNQVAKAANPSSRSSAATPAKPGNAPATSTAPAETAPDSPEAIADPFN